MKDARDLDQVRTDIDAIDREIQELLERRAECAQRVADIKMDEVQAARARGEADAEVVYYRPEREAQVLRRIMDRNRGPLAGATVAQDLPRDHVRLPGARKTLAGGVPGARGNLYPGRRDQAFRARRRGRAPGQYRGGVLPGGIRGVQLRRGAGGELHRGHGDPHPGQFHGFPPEDFGGGGDAHRSPPAGGGAYPGVRGHPNLRPPAGPGTVPQLAGQTLAAGRTPGGQQQR